MAKPTVANSGPGQGFKGTGNLLQDFLSSSVSINKLKLSSLPKNKTFSTVFEDEDENKGLTLFSSSCSVCFSDGERVEVIKEAEVDILKEVVFKSWNDVTPTPAGGLGFNWICTHCSATLERLAKCRQEIEDIVTCLQSVMRIQTATGRSSINSSKSGAVRDVSCLAKFLPSSTTTTATDGVKIHKIGYDEQEDSLLDQGDNDGERVHILLQDIDDTGVEYVNVSAQILHPVEVEVVSGMQIPSQELNNDDKPACDKSGRTHSCVESLKGHQKTKRQAQGGLLCGKRYTESEHLQHQHHKRIDTTTTGGERSQKLMRNDDIQSHSNRSDTWADGSHRYSFNNVVENNAQDVKPDVLGMELDITDHEIVETVSVHIDAPQSSSYCTQRNTEFAHIDNDNGTELQSAKAPLIITGLGNLESRGTEELDQDPLDLANWQVLDQVPLLITSSLENERTVTVVNTDKRRCSCPNCTDINARNKGGLKRQHLCHILGCGKAYYTTTNLRAHLRWHAGDKPFVCQWPLCGKRFTKSDYLQNHHRTHTQEKPFLCQWPRCGKRFTRSDHLQNHRKTHTGEKRFQCPECLKKFPRKQNLSRHMETHSNADGPRSQSPTPHSFIKAESDDDQYLNPAVLNMRFDIKNEDKLGNEIHKTKKQHPCHIPGCGKVYQRPANLHEHLRWHAGMRSFVCQWLNCGKRYMRSFDLENHRKSHTGEKPFLCRWPHCGKRFTNSDALKRHRRSHTGERPFVCQWPRCGKRFTRSDHLENHRAIHTREKLQCPECLKKFTREDYLSKHIKSHSNSTGDTSVDKSHPHSFVNAELRLHTGERPFVCDWPNCAKRFKMSHHLQNHHRIHTGEKHFQCPECPKKFGRKAQLDIHVKHVHSNSIIAIVSTNGYQNQNPSLNNEEDLKPVVVSMEFDIMDEERRDLTNSIGEIAHMKNVKLESTMPEDGS